MHDLRCSPACVLPPSHGSPAVGEPPLACRCARLLPYLDGPAPPCGPAGATASAAGAAAAAATAGCPALPRRAPYRCTPPPCCAWPARCWGGSSFCAGGDGLRPPVPAAAPPRCRYGDPCWCCCCGCGGWRPYRPGGCCWARCCSAAGACARSAAAQASPPPSAGGVTPCTTLVALMRNTIFSAAAPSGGGASRRCLCTLPSTYTSSPALKRMACVMASSPSSCTKKLRRTKRAAPQARGTCGRARCSRM